MDHAVENPAFHFSTKAETLDRLRGQLTKGRLCDQIIVGKIQWQSDPEAVLEHILDAFKDRPLIVRSSARAEDTWGNSLAGAHLSIADVMPQHDLLSLAIDDVFASYQNVDEKDQVLVQPMVGNVAISGVVLTRDLDTGSPYFVINYDDNSGRTDTVTGGKESKSLLVRRASTQSLKSQRMCKLVECVVQLEEITGTHNLDIEFCITDDESIYILQVRPLAAQSKWTALADGDVDGAIDAIRGTITTGMQPTPELAGHSTIFAEMTDWNPAEMIGNTPRPLALSLYKALITDHIWAEARQKMGYKFVDGPLLIDFHGRPYIDVRKSFNSFLPANVSDATAEKLINHQLQKLADNRSYHDKVEFEICVTCWDFSPAQSRQRFADAGLSDAESHALETALSTLTRAALVPGAKGLEPLLDDANSLLVVSNEDINTDSLDRVRQFLDDCRRKGTLNFSQLARHGFIGVQFLKSLVHRNALSVSEMDAFMHSISTVASTLANDFYALTNGLMLRDAFLEQYGHLRPGTYDIQSWRYDERPDLYLEHGDKKVAAVEHPPFELSSRARVQIETLLHDARYDITADHLLDYITAAIKGREQAKFAFTRSISNALSVLAAWGKNRGLSRDDLSFLTIENLESGFNEDMILKCIADARHRYTLTRAVRLPHVITSADDVDVIRMPLGHPTFITNLSVTAQTMHLTSVDTPDIDNRIILIESADPGFDWIFTHNILGLITKYGGANSHMAIRCAEFGLPAAIGCGERLFDTLLKAPVIELNAAAKRLNRH